MMHHDKVMPLRLGDASLVWCRRHPDM
jgi:hypothetical protein